MADTTPWPLDLLTKLTNVVRAGNFVVITNGPEAFFVTSDGKPTKISLTSPYGKITQCTGCSFHGKVCVLVGTVEGDDGFLKTIYYSSTNGRQWNLAHTVNDSEADCRGGPVVWGKDKSFHAWFAIQTGAGDEAVVNGFEISSANGFSWGGRTDVGAIHGEAEGYRSPFPKKYCTQNKCVDVWGQNVPDGFMYQAKSLSVAPQNPPPMAYSAGQIAFQTDAFTGSNGITVTGGEDPGPAAAPLEAVYCVAVKGGVWLAGGLDEGGRIALSSNGGKTWKHINLQFDPVTGINVVSGIVAVPFTG